MLSILILQFMFDDIVIIGDDHYSSIQLKLYLSSHFHMKDLDLLRCFLGSEVAHSSKDLFLSQRKCLIDFLEEISTLGFKLIDILMDPNIHFDQNLGEPLVDLGKYRRLIGKLIYLIVT